MRIYGIYFNEITGKFEVIELKLGDAKVLSKVMKEYKIVEVYTRTYVYERCKKLNGWTTKSEYEKMGPFKRVWRSMTEGYKQTYQHENMQITEDNKKYFEETEND